MPEFHEVAVLETPATPEVTPVYESESEKYPIWQGIMTGAYDFWGSKEGMKYSDFIKRISHMEQVAVLLGNLHYQIGNGGFRQWVDNGYVLQGEKVIAILRKIGETCPIAMELADKITTLIEFVDMDSKDSGWGDYWLCDSRGESRWDDDEEEERYEERDCEGEDYANSLDDWYYDVVTPVLCPAIEVFLSKM